MQIALAAFRKRSEPFAGFPPDPEKRAAEAHMGCAHLDGGLIIAAYADRQRR